MERRGLPNTSHWLLGFVQGILFILPTTKLVSNEIMSAVKMNSLKAGLLDGLRERQLPNFFPILETCIKQDQGHFANNESNKQKNITENVPNS